MTPAQVAPAANAAPSAGFSLIELIGVIAIIGILASIVAPTVVKSIDYAAVAAEKQNLQNVEEHVKRYLRTYGVVPVTPAVPYPAAPLVPLWCTEFARLADLSPQELYMNKRAVRRVYLADAPLVPGGPVPRVMIISKMRNDAALTVPTTANAALFNNIWNTAGDQVPPGFGGWSNVPGTGNSVEYLVIERINLQADNQTFTVSLKNLSTTQTVAYDFLNADGTSARSGSLGPGGATTQPMRTGQRCNLFNGLAPITLNYTYVVSSNGRSIEYDGTNWMTK